MYSKETLEAESKCPAICKLRDSDEEDDTTCDYLEDDLAVPDRRENAHAINIRSPRYPCNLPYRSEEVCLYNISLACDTEHVIVSSTASPLSSLSLAKGDFLEIIDYSQNQNPNGRITLQRDFHVHTSQFVVLFSSSKSDKASENGFSIHMECAVKSTGVHEEGSAAAEVFL